MYQRPHTPSPHAARKRYGFLRLPLGVDPEPLAAELEAATLSWFPSQWKWHMGTHLCILRAGPPGRHPGSALVSGKGVDAPDLARLPRIAQVLDTLFPVPAALAWIGRMPVDKWIHLHIDNTRHWDEHHRIHIPLVTNPGAKLCVRGRFHHFPAGTVWAFNNSRAHGACNAGDLDRVHLVLDLAPTPEVEALLAAGEPVAGDIDRAAMARLCRDPFDALTAEQRADASLMARLRLQ